MKRVEKKVATKNTCNPFDGLVIKVGTEPKMDRSDGAWRCFRDWQEAAWKALRRAFFGLLISPTGSGKSVVQVALAFGLAEAGERVIVAVPETGIGQSFGQVFKYKLPDNRKVTWAVPKENQLFAHLKKDSGSVEQSTVKRVIAFLENEMVPSKGGVVPPGDRILVCTHAALVAVFKRLQDTGRMDLWRGVNVFIDEAHHCKFDDDATAEEIDRCNRLGQLVEHYVTEKPGKMLLTTATWFRGDAETIVPEEHIANFKTFEYHIDEFLANQQHLREIVFNVILTENVADVVADGARIAPKAKTLVYLQHVMPGEGERGVKAKRLKASQDAYGPSKVTDGGMSRTHQNGTVEVEFVTVTDRDKKRAWFYQNIDKVDLVICQNVFREGWDWPAAERAMVLGARSSLQMIVQMLGRLFRDFEGKRRVEFNMVLPGNFNADIDQFGVYSGTIFMIMALGWQFSMALPNKLRSQRVVRAVAAKCREQTMRGGEKRDPGEAMRAALKGAVEGLTDEEADAPARELLSCMRGMFRMAARSVEPFMKATDYKALTKQIEDDPFEAGKGTFQAQWRGEVFQQAREKYIELPAITAEYTDQVIFLSRCKWRMEAGQYVDPRTIKGAVELFGSMEKLDRMCTAEGM